MTDGALNGESPIGASGPFDSYSTTCRQRGGYDCHGVGAYDNQRETNEGSAYDMMGPSGPYAFDNDVNGNFRVQEHWQYTSIIKAKIMGGSPTPGFLPEYDFSFTTKGGGSDGTKRNVIQVCPHSALQHANSEWFANAG